MLKTICYISSIAIKTSQKDLSQLSDFVVWKNNLLHITGILIIQHGHFFQIMEGTHKIIENLFNKIKVDQRHSGLIKLLDTTIEHRFFGDYDSGHFSIIHDFYSLKKLRVYFEWIKEANILTIDKLVTLTNTFLNSNR